MAASVQWQNLNSSVSWYEPPATSARPENTDPSVILLFGWMDARFAHLRKYAESLHDNYPRSTIFVVQSSSAYFWQSTSSREALFNPVVLTLKKLLEEDALSNGILIHCFSNGGAFQLMTLQHVLAGLPPPPKSIPCALVLDSSPGDNGLASAVSSMAPANPVLWALAAPLIALAYGLFYVRNVLSGKPEVFSEMRSALLQPAPLPPLVSAQTPRVYIYSAKDKMVNVKDVEAHIAAAKSAGLAVVTERFDSSPHVAHARSDADRYWQAIRSVWIAAQQRS